MIIPPTAILEAEWLSWPTDTTDLVLAQQVKNEQLTALSVVVRLFWTAPIVNLCGGAPPLKGAIH